MEEDFDHGVIRFLCENCSSVLDIVSTGLGETWQIRIKKCDCKD